MATRVYITPVGTDLDSIVMTHGQIAGIGIDNPSGSWLFVTGIRQYVPPYRLGWSYPVSPQAASLSVQFVDSPSGSQSVQVGDPVTVTLSDTPVQHSEGFTSGAGARVSIVPPALTAFALVGCVWIGQVDAPATVVAAGTNQRIIVRRLSTLPDLSSGLAGLDPALLCNVWLVWDIFPSLLFTWNQFLTPEQSYVNEIIEDGAIIIPPGDLLRVRAYAEDAFFVWPGAGPPLTFPNIGLIAQAQYYIENV